MRLSTGHYSISFNPQTFRAPLLLTFCILATSQPALTQALPQFEATGVVNAASYAQPLSPGTIATIFGANLVSQTVIGQGNPLPTELAGTSVTVSGPNPVKAPLLFVSPNQINFQVPWEIETIGIYSYTYLGVTVTTPAGSTATGPLDPLIDVLYSSPAIFSVDSSGCGQAAALNVRPDGTVSVNSPSNSAEPGDYISLYGTGFGIPQNLPADGAFSNGPDSIQDHPYVILGGTRITSLQYAGLAPLMVGAGQINFQIPAGTREGCAISVSLEGGVSSPALSIAVHSGGGQCSDPPTQSYGLVTLTKSFVSGNGASTVESDNLTATFPFGPGLQFPEPNMPSANLSPFPPIPPISRSCPINGTGQLSAGAVSIQAAGNQQAITAQPVSAVGGVSYQQALPSGFVVPGQYTIGASGPPVAFQGVQMTIPPPMQLQTQLPAGTQVSDSQSLTIFWTGAGAGTTVKITVSSFGICEEQVGSPCTVFAYADGQAGSYTFAPCPDSASPNQSCTTAFGPGGGNIAIDEFPAAGYATTVNAAGVTGGVQLSWDYHYEFDNLDFSF